MILCGSEDKFVYIWQTHHDVANVRNDRNEYYECFSGDYYAFNRNYDKIYSYYS